MPTGYWRENLKGAGRPRRTVEDKMMMKLKEIVWEGVDWI